MPNLRYSFSCLNPIIFSVLDTMIKLLNMYNLQGKYKVYADIVVLYLVELGIDWPYRS